jgi:hypothetical protein
MLFSLFRLDKWSKSLNIGKVFQYLFENMSIFVVNSTDIDNAAMLRLYFLWLLFEKKKVNLSLFFETL